MAKKQGKEPAPKPSGLKGVLAAIEKEHGERSIIRLGDHSPGPVRVVPTGSPALDVALGCGGLPRGRIVEIYGPESSGKTTLALHAVAQAQRAGGVVAYVDAEHALDTSYAEALGVDVENLLFSQPDSGEQALNVADMLVQSREVDLVVVDSVAALTPRAELEGQIGDSHVGLQARMMGQTLRKIAGVVSKAGCLVIFINQLRMKVGVMFGNPETTPGGNALKFYASVRLDVRRIGALKDGDKVVGNRTRIKVVKNKLSPPFREAEVDIIYGRGISAGGDLVTLGEAAGILEKSGAWVSYGGEKIGQGRAATVRYLEEHPEVAEEIRGKVLAHHGIGEQQQGDTSAKRTKGKLRGPVPDGAGDPRPGVPAKAGQGAEPDGEPTDDGR